MHKCTYTDKIIIENKTLVRKVTAHYKDKKLDVYKDYENGIYKCRNLYQGVYGYVVSFPDETTSLYKNGCCSFIQEKEEFCKTKRKNGLSLWTDNYSSDEDKEKILNKYPDFKYIFNKYDFKKHNKGNEEIMKVLKIWINHKDIEFPLSLNLYHIAINKNFYRLKKENKSRICKFIFQNQKIIKDRYINLTEIQSILKNKISREEISDFISVTRRKLSADVYRYLKKKNLLDYCDVSEYIDYISLCKKTNHDITCDYWKYPNDLHKKHQKVLDEYNNILEMERLEREMKRLEDLKKFKEQRNKEILQYCNDYNIRKERYDEYYKILDKLDLTSEYADKEILYPLSFEFAYTEKKNELIKKEKMEIEKLNQYLKVVNKYLSYNCKDYKGYEIFIPTTIEQWQTQAKKLNQCLISNNYMQQVINENCVLVFIRQNGEPVATCEMRKGNIIGQFNGNQCGNQYTASDKVKKIFNEWQIEKNFYVA